MPCQLAAFRSSKSPPKLLCSCAKAPQPRGQSKGIACKASRREASQLLVASLLCGSLADLPTPRAARAESPQLQPMSDAQRRAVADVSKKLVTTAKAPLMLRLLFHDAITYRAATGDGGPNASVQFELERGENAGLKRGWSTIVEARKQLSSTAASDLSSADLIAACAAAAVASTGGPQIAMLVGRQDAGSADPEGRLPREDFSVGEMKDCFATAGFNLQELVCLSGAHTLGAKGFGAPDKFDVAYFDALLKKPWTDKSNSMAAMIGLPSDRVMADSEECRPIIERYAGSQKAFFSDFAACLSKLANLGYA